MKRPSSKKEKKEKKDESVSEERPDDHRDPDDKSDPGDGTGEGEPMKRPAASATKGVKAVKKPAFRKTSSASGKKKQNQDKACGSMFSEFPKQCGHTERFLR